MKILHSIVGFGYGHAAEQVEVIKALEGRGHQVALLASDVAAQFYRDRMPHLPVFDVRAPKLPLKGTGIDFRLAAQEPLNQVPDAYTLNFAAYQAVLDLFGGPPALVFSDYEMAGAQFAYAHGLPLISIDQHSKYGGYLLPEVGGFSRLQEKHRLQMCLPAADVRFAMSFFEVDWPADPSFPVTLVPPTLRREIYAAAAQPSAAQPGQLLVYMSPYVEFNQSFEEMCAVFNQFEEQRFILFRPQAAAPNGNVEVRAYDGQAFIDALATSTAVISTAGFNLLCEAALLRKPVYTMPVGSYDQQFCAYIIEKYGLGLNAGGPDITAGKLRTFFDRLGEYQANLQAGRGLLPDLDGLPVLMQHLEQQFGI